MPRWLHSIDQLAPSHTINLSPDRERDWLSIPARPGVAIFESAPDHATFLAATADLRALARKRLADPGASGEPSAPRPDHRAIASSVTVRPAGSSLEVEWLYLHLARQRMPDTHRIVSERWRAWFVHVDAEALHPHWSKSCLTGTVAPRSASTAAAPSGESTESRIGPIPNKDAAGRLIDRTIDAFDLCRYHNLLVQAPGAAPCAYKEMGRCPAPCDGSESLDDYRARTRAAIRCLTGDRAAAAAPLREAMLAASAAAEFEQAAALKQRLTRLELLDAPEFAHAALLDSWSLVLVLPALRPRASSVLMLAGATLGVLGSLDPASPPESAADLARLALKSLPQAPAIPESPAPEQLDTIAVVSRWLHLARTRRRGEAIPVSPTTTSEQLTARIHSAAAALARKKTPAIDRSVDESHLELLPPT